MSRKSPATSTRANKIIWLVDNEPVIPGLLKMALEPQGFNVRIFDKPESVLAAHRELAQSRTSTKPDLIISDWDFSQNAPRTLTPSEVLRASQRDTDDDSGINTKHMIRTLNAANPSLRFIVFSGSSNPDIITGLPNTSYIAKGTDCAVHIMKAIENAFAVDRTK